MSRNYSFECLRAGRVHPIEAGNLQERQNNAGQDSQGLDDPVDAVSDQDEISTLMQLTKISPYR